MVFAVTVELDDLLVAVGEVNDASALGARTTTVTLLGRDGLRERIENRSKRDVARRLVRLRVPDRS